MIDQKEFESASQALMNFSAEMTVGPVRAGMNAAEAKSRDLWMVDREKVKVIEGFNPRIHNDAYEAHIQSIEDSMAQSGWKLAHPLEGFVSSDGTIYITGGHTRLEAYDRGVESGRVKASPIPFVPHERGTSMEDLNVGLVRGNIGKPLSPYETAIVCKRLAVNYHHSTAEVAKLLGISDKYAGQLLELAGAPVKVRMLVQEGKVSASFAIEMLAKHKDSAGDVLEAAVDGAASKGKEKATKKDAMTPEALRKKREKALCHRLFAAVELLFADKAVMNVIPKEIYKELDNVFFERDKDGEDAANTKETE